MKPYGWKPHANAYRFNGSTEVLERVISKRVARRVPINVEAELEAERQIGECYCDVDSCEFEKRYELELLEFNGVERLDDGSFRW